MRYLVHIGYPKAASSWLQTYIFSGSDPSIKPVRSEVHKLGEYQKSGWHLFFDPAVMLSSGNRALLNPFRFDPLQVRADIESLSYEDAQVTCLSNETWAGHPYSGGITGKLFADRIHATLPDAKILIVIRNQIDAILSSYGDYLLRFGGTAKFANFSKGLYWQQIPTFSPYYFRYLDMIKYYDSLFGTKNVLAIPVELLKKDAGHFVNSIYDFLDLERRPHSSERNDRNITNYREFSVLCRFPKLNLLADPTPHNGYLGVGITNVRNILLRSLGSILGGSHQGRVIARLSDEISGQLVQFYTDCNAELCDRTGYDLESLGYVCE